MEPLRKKSEFSKTYRFGKQVKIKELSIKVLPNQLQTIKLAIVVSKKVSKKAVVRNRARRRIREILRKHHSLASDGYFVIVNVYSDLNELSPSQLEDKLIQSFQKLKVFNT